MNASTLFSEPTLNFAVSVWIKTCAVLVIAWVLYLLMRRVSASARSFFWSATMTGVLLVPAFSVLLPAWDLPVEEWLTVKAEPAPQPQWKVQFSAPAMGPNQEFVRMEQFETLSEMESFSPDESIQTSGFFQPFFDLPLVLMSLVRVWIAGAVLLLGALAVSVIRVVRLARNSPEIVDEEWNRLLRRVKEEQGIERKVRLVCGPKSTVPMTWSFFGSVVFLPEESNAWSQEKRLAVLRHELAHVRRRDCQWQLLASFVCAIYWMNPLVWLAFRFLKLEQEKACDDSVITSGLSATDYADHLLKIAREFRPAPTLRLPAIAMTRRSQLETRLKSILDRKRRRTPIGWFAKLAIFIGIGLLVGCASTVETSKTVEASETTEVSPEPVLQANSPQQVDEGAELFTKIYRVDHEAFIRSLEGIVGLAVGPGRVGISGEREFVVPELDLGGDDDPDEALPEGFQDSSTIRAFFTLAGVDTEPPTTIYYKDTSGQLLVRARIEDLDLIESAIQVLIAEPQAQETFEDSTGDKEAVLFTKTYQVNPDIFAGAWTEDVGIPFGDGGGFDGGGQGGDFGGGGSDFVNLQDIVRAANQTNQNRWGAFFGISMEPPAGIYYNDRLEQLLVRATLEDLDKVENVIQTLNAQLKAQETPPNSNETGEVETEQNLDEISSVAAGSSRYGEAVDTIYAKLNSILIDEIAFDQVPLGEIVKFLKRESIIGLGGGGGINFLINPQVIDDLDMTEVRITVDPAMTDLNLKQVLDVIVTVADSPIKYTVKDYGVEFAQRVPESAIPANPQTFTKTYRVNPNVFARHLAEALNAVSPNKEWEQLTLHEKIRTYFVSAGVDLTPPATLFYNDRLGQLLVRAPMEEQELVEQIVRRLTAVPPLVNVKAKFISIPLEDARVLGLDPFMLGAGIVGDGSTSSKQNSMVGLLTDPQFRVVIRALEQRDGVDLISAPEVTTESGLQAHMESSEIIRVEGVDPDIPLRELPEDQVILAGPKLDVLPKVLPDGYSINLDMTASLTMADTIEDESTGERQQKVQKVEASGIVTVWDGQTVVLGGNQAFSDPEGNEYAVIVFVTPTIIDPAGNRLNNPNYQPYRSGPRGGRGAFGGGRGGFGGSLLNTNEINSSTGVPRVTNP